MKKFLAALIFILLTYIISPFYIAAITSWVWLPIVFDLNNILGGACLGFVIGLVITVGTEIIKDKLICD